MPLKPIFNITAERNEISKIWDNILLPLISPFKQNFHAAPAVNDYRDIRLQSLIRKGFLNQQRNEFLKTIMIHDKNAPLFFRFRLFNIWS